jgi:hypothetical protein
VCMTHFSAGFTCGKAAETELYIGREGVGRRMSN